MIICTGGSPAEAENGIPVKIRTPANKPAIIRFHIFVFNCFSPFGMCFDVFAHNRDDHSKNFTFIYDENNDGWRLSPAYDLTYSTTYYGEHTTTVDGNGRNPGIKELAAVGTAAGIGKDICTEIAYDIEKCVKNELNGN